MQTDTIVAVSSPPGPGHLAILRLSGPDAFRIAEAAFASDAPLQSAPANTIRDGSIHLDGWPKIPARAYIMRAPATYTREDVVEIHLPASAPIVEQAMRAMLAAGARAARAGEFTERAFLNGRLDLTQAEAVLRAVNAQTTSELRGAMSQLRGFAHEEIAALREKLVALMALVELNIDFSDQDIDLLGGEEAAEKIAGIRESIDGILKRAATLAPAEGIPVALYGAPNVGKSTLFNALAGAEKAIVSHVPGTTRDYLEALVEVNGVRLRLLDTAGVSETSDAVELCAQARSREQAAAADVLVLVADIRDFRGVPSHMERAPDVIALNKADLADEAARGAIETNAPPCPYVIVSALKGEGIENLVSAILNCSGALIPHPHEFVPNMRQRECLERARRAVENAGNARDSEIIAYELRAAVNALGEVVGEVPADEVLGRIFSQFCIGK